MEDRIKCSLHKSPHGLARKDFLSLHPMLWQQMIRVFQRQLPEKKVGELYCTSTTKNTIILPSF
jgi:hypothetical protein